MDTLQAVYKDSEEDAEENQNSSINTNQNQDDPTENQSPCINPSQNQENTEENQNPDIQNEQSHPNPSTSVTQIHSSPEQAPQLHSSDPEAEHVPEPIDSADNPATVAEPVTVDSADDQTTENELGFQLTEKAEPLGSEEVSSDSMSEDEQNPENSVPENSDKKLGNEDDDMEEQSPKKPKILSHVDPNSELLQGKTPASGSNNGSKKSWKKKSKGNNVWTKPTSRKGKKKAKPNNNTTPKAEDTVFIAPVPRFPDKNDDSPAVKICLSKVYKAEKVELSEDRLSAGSCKGYRMVRATRGVTEGAWFFEIKVVHLGESGHTRLGWSTEKGDLQAPVGYDANSFGYRDIDGSKIHKALREKYAEEGYKEGDVIGFYINLPNGNSYAPKPPHLVWYKGQKYVCAPDPKEDPPKIIPGSEISFFKNGVCQGIAFKDLFGGRYYPAASMYTLPNQPNCVVKFNFGPDFECFPVDLGDRPVPRSMIEVPYHGIDNRVENGLE